MNTFEMHKHVVIVFAHNYMKICRTGHYT